METRNTSEDDNFEETLLQGRRLFDVQFLFKQIKELSKHDGLFNCGIGDMNVIKEARKGFMSNFTLKCRVCGLTRDISTEKQENDDLSINLALPMATISTGIGYSQLDEICSTIEMPMVSNKSYQRFHETVSEKIRGTAWKSMEIAAKEEYDLAVKEGFVDKDGIPYITVVTDGAWSKRSYNVNYNAASGVVRYILYITCGYTEYMYILFRLA